APAPRPRRAVEYKDYTDHLEADEPARPKKKGRWLTLFMLFLFVSLLTFGIAFYFRGHEIIDYVEVHGYLEYVPEALIKYLP
ncbi:MAG: hypothetical protein AB1758_08450, partial [Candidatus Eremiobacterota bacterium]